jgi:hypothetical protein
MGVDATERLTSEANGQPGRRYSVAFSSIAVDESPGYDAKSLSQGPATGVQATGILQTWRTLLIAACVLRTTGRPVAIKGASPGIAPIVMSATLWLTK